MYKHNDTYHLRGKCVCKCILFVQFWGWLSKINSSLPLHSPIYQRAAQIGDFSVCLYNFKTLGHSSLMPFFRGAKYRSKGAGRLCCTSKAVVLEERFVLSTTSREIVFAACSNYFLP